jgi:multiple sugar transport system substrate-binding protein
MKGQRALCFIACLVIFLTAACSKNQSSSSSGTSTSNDIYKVYFYAWTNEENMVPLLEAFNDEYAGKYEMVYQKLADANSRTINIALASGERIDVMTQSSAFDVRQRAESGVYLGLKQFFQKEGYTYEDKFGKSIEETMNFGDEYYAMPYCNNINMVFFNKKMFDEAGVPYPKDDWTWDDFRAIAKRLTKGEGANKIYGACFDFASPTGGDQYWASIAQQKIGTFYFYNSDLNATRFNAPEMKESLQFFYDMVMVDKTVVPLAEYTALQYSSDPNGIAGLYSDKYAMFIAPVYASLYFNKGYGEVPVGTDVGLANMPRPVGYPDSITTTYTSQASIPANVANPEASWTAIRYICIDRADLFAGPKAMHPGYQFKSIEEANAFNQIIFQDHPGLDFDMCMRVMALPRVLISRDNSVIQGNSKISDLIRADMSSVFNGEMGVDEALADLKTKGDQYIADDLRQMNN